jgi:hypothetical protein
MKRFRSKSTAVFIALVYLASAFTIPETENKPISHTFALNILIKKADKGIEILSVTTQTHAGNRWVGTYGSGYGAVNMNALSFTNLSESLLIIDPNLGSDYNPTIPTDTLDPPFFVNDQGWIFLFPGFPFVCSGQYSCNAWLSGDDESQDLRLRIVRDSTLTSEYIPESKTIAKQYLYQKLLTDSNLLNSHEEFVAFIQENNNQNLGYLNLAGTALNEYIIPDNITQSLLLLTDSLMAIYVDSLFKADDSERNALINQLNQLLDQRSALVLQWQSRVSEKLDDAKANLLAVISEDGPFNNEKQINEIMIAYLQGGKDSIATYYNDLYSVANQCPYKGGNAVFRARVLMSILNDTLSYDDGNTCLQQGIYRVAVPGKIENYRRIIIQPNPANTQARIILNGYQYESCELTITNMLNEVITKIQFNCNNSESHLDLSRIAPGAYYVKIEMDNEYTETKKLIIIR